ELLPVKNPDILTLFKQGQLDAAWVPEPWATRLVAETGAQRVIDERDLWSGGQYATTVLVANAKFLEGKRDEVEALIHAHLWTIGWLRRPPEEARRAVNRELKRLTGKALPEAQLREAWGRLEFTADPNRASIEEFALAARAAGYLPPSELTLASLF